jgi:hypothetical protein
MQIILSMMRNPGREKERGQLMRGANKAMSPHKRGTYGDIAL